jgi:hypothetical protein
MTFHQWMITFVHFTTEMGMLISLMDCFFMHEKIRSGIMKVKS